MKVRTSVTLRIGSPGKVKHLPPGDYDKKDLVGVDVDDLVARGHAERLGAVPESSEPDGGTGGDGGSGQNGTDGQS